MNQEFLPVLSYCYFGIHIFRNGHIDRVNYLRIAKQAHCYVLYYVGLEPRILSRWDMHAFARRAWDMGIRYIGGCCGYEPYHIRALSEELIAERGGKIPDGCEKHDMWGAGLKMHTKPWVRAR